MRLWRRAPSDIDLVEAGTALVLAGIVGSSWATFYYAVFAFPALVLFSDSRARASAPLVWPFVLAVTLPITVEVEIVGNLRYLVGMSAIAALVGLGVWRGRPPETAPVVTGRI